MLTIRSVVSITTLIVKWEKGTTKRGRERNIKGIIAIDITPKRNNKSTRQKHTRNRTSNCDTNE